MAVVTFIAARVVFFSKDYMAGDPTLERFMWVVFIFVLSIIALIIRPNIIRILLGWDGLGLVSYCLVIYYQNVKSYNAGMLTALSNRVGDVIILIAIALTCNTGTFNFTHVINIDIKIWGPICLLMAIAACTKSAQIPFSAWLPAAIAAPTPVSALVHSSTLVTAGVYLIIRFYKPLISIGLNKPIFIISILTILMAGLGATLETDLKKIIALSTLSQLGLIIIAIGLGIVKLAYLHMLTHALFKALLFICAGNIIHGINDNQDLRKVGTLCLQVPLTSACLNTANLALCGAPFITGFYSKDIILEAMLITSQPHACLVIVYLATALTVTYSVRLRFYTMRRITSINSVLSINDLPKFSSKALVPLTLLSISGGAILSWILIPNNPTPCLPLTWKIIILVVLTIGWLTSISILKFNLEPCLLHKSTPTIEFLGSIWFLPTLATRFYSWPLISLGFLATYLVDRGWNEHTSAKIFGSQASTIRTALQSQQISSIKIHLTTYGLWFILVLLTVMICFSSLIWAKFWRNLGEYNSWSILGI
jgi:NADH-ubiquinone oxidoreductase chain 5